MGKKANRRWGIYLAYFFFTLNAYSDPLAFPHLSVVQKNTLIAHFLDSYTQIRIVIGFSHGNGHNAASFMQTLGKPYLSTVGYVLDAAPEILELFAHPDLAIPSMVGDCGKLLQRL